MTDKKPRPAFVFRAFEDSAVLNLPVLPRKDAANVWHIHGAIFECNATIAFTEGGKRDWQDLRAEVQPIPPTQWVIEEWAYKGEDEGCDQWEHVRNHTFRDIVWLTREHSTDGWNSACWAIITFTCSGVEVTEGSLRVIRHPAESYPISGLKRVLKESLHD